MIGIILAVSTVIWFVVDRFKQIFPWQDLSYGNWITTGIVAILATIAVCTFQLDIFVSCEIVDTCTVFGMIMTVLLIAGGSSCIAEIIKKIKA